MAKKRPSGTKRFRERARRERQEEKARRKAAKKAEKEGSPVGPPNDDSADPSAAGSEGREAFGITREAFELLVKILERENVADGVAVRFLLADDGAFSLSFDRLQPGDETFAYDGRIVVVMEPAAARRLENDTLDVEESSDGMGLILTGRPGSGASGP